MSNVIKIVGPSLDVFRLRELGPRDKETGVFICKPQAWAWGGKKEPNKNNRQERVGRIKKIKKKKEKYEKTISFIIKIQFFFL